MTRTRSITTDKVNLCRFENTTDGGSSWNFAANLDMKSPAASAKIMIDSVTPGYKLRSAKGEVIMNSLWSVSSDIRRDGVYNYNLVKRIRTTGVIAEQIGVRAINGTFTSQHRAPRTMMADMPGVDFTAELAAFGLTTGSMTSIEQSVLASALEKATSPDVLSLVSAAELDKTVELVVSASKAVNGMARTLESLGPKRIHEFNAVLRRLAQLNKKRLMKQFLKTLDKGLRTAASAWLGYRYGIMTTIYDVQSWTAATQGKTKRVRVTANRTSQFESVPAWTVTPNYHGGGWPNTGPFYTRVERRRETTTTAGVLIDTSAITNADRFGVNRVASTVWELIPYSFVLDWLIDASTRIAAHEGTISVRPLGTWITHEHRLMYAKPYYWLPNSSVDSTYSYEVSGADSGQVVETTVHRVRIPNPTLGVLPQIDVKLNWKRMTDSVALLIAAKSRYMKHSRI